MSRSVLAKRRLLTKAELVELREVRKVLGRLMLDVGRTMAPNNEHLAGASAARLGNAWDLVCRVIRDAEL